MKHTILLFFLITANLLVFSQNVTNVQVEQIGMKVHVTYTLDKTADITLHLSKDGGVTYSEPLKQVSGDVGNNIPAGTHTIVWDVLAEKDKLVGDNFVFLVKSSIKNPLKFSVKDTVNGFVFEMVFVEGGTFTMGCSYEQGYDCDNDEKPTHQVKLSDFFIGKYEVTQELWKTVMGTNPSYYNGSNLPVEQVSKDDIREFIFKLNTITGHIYRLPTEAEWEYAARGGNIMEKFKYSGSNSLDKIAWFHRNSNNQTHKVGTKQANALGIHDMSGNVWEFCQDGYGIYSSDFQINPQGFINVSSCIIRGGCWDNNPGYCRVSDRYFCSPNDRYRTFGFRLVRVK